jgi:hypothetical protein
VQALADQSQKRPIGDPNLEHLLQLLAIQAVEEGHNVSLKNPTHLASVYDPVKDTNSVMGTALGTEAMRAVQKVLLVYCLQHLADDVLDKFVLERRDPNWPRLARFLWDVDTSDRLMAVTLRPHPLVQVTDIWFQLLPVLFLRDSIHAYRSVLAATAIGPLQG